MLCVLSGPSGMQIILFQVPCASPPSRTASPSYDNSGTRTGSTLFNEFEYAVLAEPILDLASLAGMNDFSADQQTRLVDAYYHGADRPFTMAKFTDVVRLIRLVSYFWALAGHREDYQHAAAEQFVEKLTAVLR